jgi:hypothetical protein
MVKVSGSTNGHSFVRNVPIISLAIFLLGILLLGRATETGVRVAILLWWLKWFASEGVFKFLGAAKTKSTRHAAYHGSGALCRGVHRVTPLPQNHFGLERVFLLGGN